MLSVIQCSGKKKKTSTFRFYPQQAFGCQPFLTLTLTIYNF